MKVRYGTRGWRLTLGARFVLTWWIVQPLCDLRNAIDAVLDEALEEECAVKVLCEACGCVMTVSGLTLRRGRRRIETWETRWCGRMNLSVTHVVRPPKTDDDGSPAVVEEDEIVVFDGDAVIGRLPSVPSTDAARRDWWKTVNQLTEDLSGDNPIPTSWAAEIMRDHPAMRGVSQ